MRIDISYKFIAGFLLVVASIVIIGMIVPLLGVQEELRQLVTITSAIVIGLILGVAFSRAFTANIQRVNDGANRLSHGDLTTKIEIRKPFFDDEIVDLAASLNAVSTGLSKLVTHIRGASESVAVSAHGLSFTALDMNVSSRQVADTVEKIAYGVDLQADMVEKASHLIKDVALFAELVAASAQKLSHAAEKTAETAGKGESRAIQTTEMMRGILKETEIVAQRMDVHSIEIQKINSFVDVIIHIANQSNLLSHSAQDEAERIGEHAPGLTLLAQNIRSLAESANSSAADITLLTESIYDENQAIRASMAETVQRVKEGRSALDITSHAFEAIIADVTATREKAVSIAELSQSQTEGVKGIVLAIDEISRVTNENAQGARETADATSRQTMAMSEMVHAANYLNTLAEDLKQTVQQFQLDTEDSPDSV